MCLNKLSSVITFFVILLVLSSNWSQAQVSKNKATTLSGKIYRSDTNQPIPGANIHIRSYQGNRLETKTDEKGNYSFEQVKAGKYRITISVRYNTITDVPCKLGTGATADKDSYVNMKDEGLGYIDVWVYIDPFRVNLGKPITKDFDVACKGFSKKGSKR